MNLNDFAKTKRTGESAMLYGPPKCGKTRFASILAKNFNLVWLDLENGLQSVIRNSELKEEDRARIQVISVPDTKQNPVAVDTVLKVLTGAAVSICTEHGRVACLHCARDKKESQTIEMKKCGRETVLVIDSGTQFSDSAWAHIIGPDLDAATEWRHFDKWNQRIAMALSFIQQAPYHVVMIGHGMTIEQEDGKEKMVPKMGTKAFSCNVAKYFSHVLYLETRAGAHKVGSTADFAVNVLIGNRAGIKWEDGKSKFADFFAA